MIFETPALRDVDRAVLDEIDGLREELGFYLRQPRRWFGTLRRATFARAVQGSNSIEGYHASVEDVAAVIEGEEPLEADEETRRAIEGYRDAMTYVLQMATDPPRIDASLLKALHFMMLKYDLTKHPGQWRPGAIWVEDLDGHLVYEAPDRSHLDALIAELVDSMEPGRRGEPLVKAAMAHLNLVMIHPFSDGNGRMARCLQSLVLVCEGIAHPEMSSIEEYLGRNTPDYYAALAEIGGGAWRPERGALRWVEFCLRAHHRQALTLQRRIREMEALWDRCEQLAERHRLPSRTVGALSEAARGWRLRRSLYIKVVSTSNGEDITEATATRDLRAMTDAGLLAPQGEKRARQYLPTDELRAVWTSIRSQRSLVASIDPYERLGQPTLPGISG